MTINRRGEKIGWTAGWAGGFIWVLILSVVFLFQGKTEHGVLGVVLVGVSMFIILFFSPWRFASTYYWKLMLAPYGLFYLSAEIEKEMLRLAKEKKSVIFCDADVFETEHGRLVRELSEKISIPRDALAKCEEYCFNDAIRITKSLDRAVLEKWPDEKLFLVGAKRQKVEKIDYELKGIKWTG